MTIFLCPSNCEHEWEFAHSLVTKRRTVKEKGAVLRETVTFLICRSCNHWTGRNVSCSCDCHETTLGFTLTREPVIQSE